MLSQGLVVGIFQLVNEWLECLQDRIELFEVEDCWVEGDVDGLWHGVVLVQADRRWRLGVLLKQSK